MREKRTVGKRIASASILMICIIASFAVYMQANLRMTVSRNANYVEDAATQTVRRIEDILIGAENSIKAIAHLCGQNPNADRISIDMLQRIVDDTPFDYMGIVDASGVYTDNRGNQAQVSDRFYFVDGMAGNAGMDIIFNGRIAHENLMIFYAPVWFEGEVVGVLTGHYGENQMREIIAATYFDEPATTYLCLTDGTVFSSSNDSTQPQNILTALQNTEGTDQETIRTLEKALKDGRSQSLTYKSVQGSNAAFVTRLPGKDWMLLQVFPIKVTNAMLSESNALAMYLELWLVLLFVAYVVLLVMENRKQKARLVMEKQEMRDIVDCTSQLFKRFVLVNLNDDSYEYLKSDIVSSPEAGGGSPGVVLLQKGRYTQLWDYWSKRAFQEDKHVRNKLTISAIQQSLTEDTPFLQYEYRVQEESLRWTQISVLCLKRREGVAASVLMAVQDVTELKEAELKNRMAMEEAYRAAKAASEAKTLFLSNMSHDMRTPMNAIMGFAKLMDRDAANADKVREYNAKISASGQQLLTLINNVLEMSKMESGKTSLDTVEFTLKELLEEVEADIRPQIREKQQALEVRACAPGAESLLGDRLRLGQILHNLLSNAVNYTPAGGHIELSVESGDEITRGYAHLCFQVRDNGIGIKPEFLQHIFEPFTRENNTTVSGVLGAGLGMAITRSLVDMMGGTISVESAPGKGSAFRVEVELRRGAKPAGDGAEEAAAAQPDAGGLEGLRVLVAEDNDINAEILEELLDFEGVSCERAVNGQEAVKRFEAAPPHSFDAVLMDIQMPVMDGYEAARAIRASAHPDAQAIPIIAMTANAFAEDVQRSIDAGMNVHLSKPIDMGALKGVLMEYVRSDDRRGNAT